jgi:hypothetical protein
VSLRQLRSGPSPRRRDRRRARTKHARSAPPSRRRLPRKIEDSVGWYEFEEQARAEVGALTEFSDYTEQGGEDYRELLLTLPNVAGPSTHWSEPNVVAHLRFKSRQSTDGKRVMFIEEVQSDWHQKGRDQGYVRKLTEDEQAALLEAKVLAELAVKQEKEPFLDAARKAFEAEKARVEAAGDAGQLRNIERNLGYINNTGNPYSVARDVERYWPGDVPADLRKALDAFHNAELKLNEARQAESAARQGIPDAPFRASWPALVMKRAIRWAVDNGFEQVAWTTGEQQRERYDLASAVGEIVAQRVREDTDDYEVRLDYPVASAIVERGLGKQESPGLVRMKPAQITEVFGKDLGGRMVARADENMHDGYGLPVRLQGEDLKIGGEGMLGFYDRNLVNITNDLVKKYGTKVRPVAVEGMGELMMSPEERAQHQALNQEWLAAARAVQLGGLEGEALEQAKAKQAEINEQMKGLEAGKGTNPGFDITPELKEVAQQGFALFQRQRGAYSPATDTITLLQNADLSTFLHESGHFFLEVMHRLATDAQAPQPIKDDFDTALNWMGVKDVATWEGMSLEQKRNAHEKWARGFEAYLFTGKSPSVKLTGLFQRFRAWLVAVYKKAAALDVTVSPQVRAVMDRLLATDAEIEEAEAARSMLPMLDLEEHMSEDEWRAYQSLGEKATSDAADDLEARSLRDMRWLANAKGREINRLKREAKAVRTQTRAQVTREVLAEPVYRAMTFLKSGAIDGQKTDGPHKLYTPEIAAEYGEEKAALLEQLRGMTTSTPENGVHPAQVAELFGFTSVDHLLVELTSAEPLNEKIEGLTEQRLLEDHGDLTDPAAIEAAADKAVHNEARTRFVTAELSALSKAIGDRKTLAPAARAYAEAAIARQRVRDVKPSLYEAAAARAARASEKALKSGNLHAAASEKRNQLINLNMAREANRARNDVDRALAYLGRLTRAGAAKSIAPEYRAQIDNILESLDLRPSTTLRSIDRAESLKAFIEKQQDMGFEPVVDDSIFSLPRSYKMMTVEELRGLIDSIKNIEHLGRLKNRC